MGNILCYYIILIVVVLFRAARETFLTHDTLLFTGCVLSVRVGYKHICRALPHNKELRNANNRFMDKANVLVIPVASAVAHLLFNHHLLG